MITSEIITIAAKIIMFVINTFCVCFICLAISKWLRRLEDKIDVLKAYIKADVNMHRLAYVELLKRLRDEAIKRDDFKAVMEIQRMINEKMERRKK